MPGSQFQCSSIVLQNIVIVSGGHDSVRSVVGIWPHTGGLTICSPHLLFPPPSVDASSQTHNHEQGSPAVQSRTDFRNALPQSSSRISPRTQQKRLNERQKGATRTRNNPRRVPWSLSLAGASMALLFLPRLVAGAYKSSGFSDICTHVRFVTGNRAVGSEREREIESIRTTVPLPC